MLRTLFSWKFDPHPPPRNANNIEPYIFVTLFSVKADTPPPTPNCVTYHLNGPNPNSKHIPKTDLTLPFQIQIS